ncbi:MAG: sod [Bacteroidota bacterium]|jgi:Fe-Mn family superoxide dismutase|nr:sod [Bacteroidota bacterium]
MNDRRDFFKKIGLLGLSGLAFKLVSNEQLSALEALGHQAGNSTPFTLSPLPYTYNALEPYIDEQTMLIHHTKHHQAYVTKMNETPSTNIDFQVDDMTKCRHIDQYTSAVIRNNLGGHVNHTLFWTLLKPNKDAKPNLPSGKLAEAINRDFKSFEEFKKQFSEKASKHFGSGWCWLIEKDNKLLITTTPNQDNPLMKVAEHQGKIVLALDVWEHAYYLKYQNKRADYISNWWNVANWEKAEELYLKK